MPKALRISRRSYDRYDRLLKSLSTEAQRKVEGIVRSIDWGTTDSEHGRALNMAIEAVHAVAVEYGEMASLVAAEHYDQMTEKSGIKAESAEMEDEIAYEDIESTMDYATRSMWDNPEPDVEKMAKQAGNDVYGRVARQANMTQYRNARRDKLKYARIPSGAETCGFCLMLASRGFVYNDADVATHGHAHCDCRVIAGKQGMKLEGYDPKGLYENVYLPNKVYAADKSVDMRATVHKIEREYVRPKIREAEKQG